MNKKVEHERVLYEHFGRNQLLWDRLTAQGVGADTLIWLDFEYRVPNRKTGRALIDDLRGKTEYIVRLAGEGLWTRRRWRVLGETPPAYVSRAALDEWTDRMVQFGARHDCVFVGWGAHIP